MLYYCTMSMSTLCVELRSTSAVEEWPISTKNPGIVLLCSSQYSSASMGSLGVGVLINVRVIHYCTNIYLHYA